MKKLLVGSVIGLTILFGGTSGASAITENRQAQTVQNEVIKVKNLHGFMVLDEKVKANCSVVVVVVQDITDEYLYTTNMFDITDDIVLDNYNDFKIGDILLVTFYHDDVKNVVKNTKNIENIVIGQKVVK